MSNEKICNVKLCQSIRIASILYAPAILINARNSFRLLRNVMFWWAVVFWEKPRLILHRAFTSTNISPNSFLKSNNEISGKKEKKELSEPSFQKSIYTWGKWITVFNYLSHKIASLQQCRHIVSCNITRSFQLNSQLQLHDYHFNLYNSMRKHQVVQILTKGLPQV